ncbi:TolC family protein [Paludisphaera rhizosphaerae]|uniref:TolC family protein n=2 Tax=Paludisphaera rhizosphaerae TaxID=2711216 RepID=UPI0013EC608F|nr:TolC family protein [Paludisphaera rhizosphaerae]
MVAHARTAIVLIAALLCHAGRPPRAGAQTPIPIPRPSTVDEVDRVPEVFPRDGMGVGRAPGVVDAITTPSSPATLLAPDVRPIDLNTALRLAGAQNPQLLIARQRVVEATALRQLAAAQFLPSLNLGGNYDLHTGNLQQSNGNILSVNRSAMYVGAGSGAVAAGTVSIPGLVLEGNAAVAVYGYLAARQFQAARGFEAWAVRNQAFLQTTLAYSELLRAEGRRSIALQVRDEAKRVAELTASYANAGQGRAADAHRALTELQAREYDIQQAEEAVLVASAQLCFVLNIDPSVRLHPTDAFVVPHPIVPDPTPVAELIALGLLQRPELKEWRASIQEALMVLDGARALPFSPTVLIGYSAGGFGGGSNLVRPVVGGFGGRQDLDVVGFWTLQNLGVGNASLINVAKARLGVAKYREIFVLDQVRAEVAEAYAKTHARYARIETSERAVESGIKGFAEDLLRIENTVAPAIETVDSLRLLARARNAYLDAIIDYDRAQFELYVALGQPPADTLARPAPVDGVGPTNRGNLGAAAQPPAEAAPAGR